MMTRTWLSQREAPAQPPMNDYMKYVAPHWFEMLLVILMAGVIHQTACFIHKRLRGRRDSGDEATPSVSLWDRELDG